MKLISAVLGCALALALSAPAFAATNVIVNVTGNNSTDPCTATLIGKTAGFEISSYSIGGTLPVNTTGDGTGAGAGKLSLSLSNLVIQKTFDACSGELIKDFLTGKSLQTVTLYDYKTAGGGNANNSDFLTITLSNVIISSYQLGGSDELPAESLSLSYAKVCIADTPQSANGSAGKPVTVCYDKTANVIAD